MVVLMLKVRLQRVGRKNDPSFRMVVIESTKGPKSANHIEILGSYNPRQKTVEVKGDRVKHWIAQGAQVSDTVNNILINQKIIEGKKRNPLGKKTPIVKEKTEEEIKAEEDAKVAAEAPVEEKSEEAKEEAPEAPAAEAEPEAVDDSKEEVPAEESKEA